MKKIVFLNNGILPYAQNGPIGAGGAERYMWLLARALAANGWSVTVGVTGTMAPGECKTLDGVEFIGMSKTQILLSWYQFLKKEQPDWLCFACATHLLGPLFQIAKLRGVGTIFSAQFDTDVTPRQALSLRRRWWPFYAWGLSIADGMVLQHGEQLSNLSARWRHKASVLPGVVEEVKDSKSHVTREKYVAWVAKIRQPKRPDVLIEIARKMPETRFVVCGGASKHRSPPGYSEKTIQAFRTTPNIEYLGHMGPEKSLEVIGNAALLLSTSDAEGFPSTFLEAWSAGTPVVSLKIDPDEIITKKEIGRVSRTVERAIIDLEQLINSCSLRQEMADRARQYVAEMHSESAVAAMFNGIIPKEPPNEKDGQLVHSST